MTPWTAAHQAPPSTGFSMQEYWSGVPLASPYLGTTATNLTVIIIAHTANDSRKPRLSNRAGGSGACHEHHGSSFLSSPVSPRVPASGQPQGTRWRVTSCSDSRGVGGTQGGLQWGGPKSQLRWMALPLRLGPGPAGRPQGPGPGAQPSPLGNDHHTGCSG